MYIILYLNHSTLRFIRQDLWRWSCSSEFGLQLVHCNVYPATRIAGEPNQSTTIYNGKTLILPLCPRKSKEDQSWYVDSIQSAFIHKHCITNLENSHCNSLKTHPQRIDGARSRYPRSHRITQRPSRRRINTTIPPTKVCTTVYCTPIFTPTHACGSQPPQRTANRGWQ